MDESLVLTVIGDDRPGLVEALSETVAAHDGNWLESRMARLAGKFAGVLRLSVPAERVGGLREALGALATRGLRVAAEGGGAAPPAGRAVFLELLGADHPGIVRRISAVLSRRGVNVEELRTECTDAPHTAQPLFRARAELLVPAALSLDELRAELEDVAHDLMVDVSVGDPASRRRGQAQ